MRKVLVTGTAGFIGFHLAQELMAEGYRVHGYDGMTDYYDVGIKQKRHAMLSKLPSTTAEVWAMLPAAHTRPGSPRPLRRARPRRRRR